MIEFATVVARVYVARFRLRFLLQELELSGPTVTIGRSSECQITLDDPLVSRVHAQITITDIGATVRDLGSRNGVRVNDQLIDGETLLAHDDRVRLGTQDLLFVVADGLAASARTPRATGAMAHCVHCGRPFPGEAPECPRCGAPARARSDAADTFTDVSPDPLPSWTFRLLGEVIERALAAGRLPEAERMLQRAVRDLESSRLTHRLGKGQVAEAAGYALRLAGLTRGVEWAEWTLRLHRREHMLPTSEVIQQLEALDASCQHALRPEVEALLVELGEQLLQPSEDEQRRESRLRAMVTRAAG